MNQSSATMLTLNKSLVISTLILHIVLLYVYMHYWSVPAMPSSSSSDKDHVVDIVQDMILSEEEIFQLRQEIEKEFELKQNMKVDVEGLLMEFQSAKEEYKQQFQLTQKAYDDFLNSNEAVAIISNDAEMFAPIEQRKVGIMNNDDNNPVISALKKLQSITSLDGMHDTLSQVISDLKEMRKACEVNVDMCDAFRFSGHLPTDEEGFDEPTHLDHICNEIKKRKNERSNFPDEADLDLYLKPVIDAISARETFLAAETTSEDNQSLPLHPKCLERISSELQKAAEEASTILNVHKENFQQNIDNLESSTTLECMQPIEIQDIVREELKLQKKRIKSNVLSPFVGTILRKDLSSLSENIGSRSMFDHMNSEFLEKLGMVMDSVVDIIGGHSSLIDKFLDLLAGDYGDGVGGGSLRASFMTLLRTSNMNPTLSKIIRKIEFLFALKSDNSKKIPSFCLETSDNGVGFLTFDFRKGYNVRLSEIQFRLSNISDNSFAPFKVMVFGLTDIAGSAQNRTLLGQKDFNEVEGKSTFHTLSLGDVANDDEGAASDDKHSCKFDTRQGIRSLLLEFVSNISPDKSQNFCVESILATGDFSTIDERPICAG